MEHLRTLKVRHAALKKKIHEFRMPLSERGQKVMFVVYAVAGMVFAWQATKVFICIDPLLLHTLITAPQLALMPVERNNLETKEMYANGTLTISEEIKRDNKPFVDFVNRKLAKAKEQDMLKQQQQLQQQHKEEHK